MPDEEKKRDFGRIREVLSETERLSPIPKGKDSSGVAIPSTALKERADLTTTTGASLIEKVVSPTFVGALFDRTWVKELGCTMFSNLEGTFVVPGSGTEPTVEFKSESAALPEGSFTTEERVELDPLKVGGWQAISKQEILQAKGQMAQMNLQDQLLGKFREVVDQNFLNGSGVAPLPRGILNISGIEVIEAAGGTGDDVRGANKLREKILEAKGKLLANSQYKNPVFMLSSSLQILAENTLRFSVSGAEAVYQNGKLLGMKSWTTEQVPHAETKGASTDLVYLVCIIPQSVVCANWYNPRIEVNPWSETEWKKDAIPVKIVSYTNIGVSRKKDIVLVKDLDISA